MFLFGAGTLEGDDISHNLLPKFSDDHYTTPFRTTREMRKMVIEVAAYGWQGGQWDAFYPEDIPAEWRLDFYGNEFFAVVAPWEAWRREDDEELLEWQGQVSDDFRFYWELPQSDEGAAAERLQSLRENDEFAAHWGGRLDKVSQLRIEAPLELRALRQAVEGAIGPAEESLLVVVEPAAADCLRSARDIALLLGGG